VRRLGGLAIVLALGVVSGCGTNFVASLNSGHGLRLVICKGGDQFCQDVLNPPSADAGERQTVAAGSRVVLDASGSNDPDGDIASFEWRQLEGPLVTLNDPNTATPTFDAPSVVQTTMLRFELTVVDDDDESDIDRVDVVVEPNANVAIVRGLEWLQASVSPSTDGLPRDVARPPDESTHFTLGTWLVATTTGRYLDRDPTHVESHLANLRGLITSLESRSTTPGIDPRATPCGISGIATLAAGLTQTARLLDGLDPALAERYRARSRGLEVAPDWNALGALYRGEPVDLCSGDSRADVDPLAGAISMLVALEAADEAQTQRVAAATLTVLGAVQRGAPQTIPSPTSTQIPLSQRSTDSPLLTNAPSS
jgi:hypothetical protein